MKIKSVLIALLVLGIPLKSMATIDWLPGGAQTVSNVSQEDCGSITAAVSPTSAQSTGSLFTLILF